MVDSINKTGTEAKTTPSKQERSKTGRTIGTLAGAGVAGYIWNKEIKGLNVVKDFFQSAEVKDAINKKDINKIESLVNNSKMLKIQKYTYKKLFDLKTLGAEFQQGVFEGLQKATDTVNNPKYINKFKKRYFAMSALTLLAGYGIGSLFDKKKD